MIITEPRSFRSGVLVSYGFNKIILYREIRKLTVLQKNRFAISIYGGCFAEIRINYNSYNEDPLKSIAFRYNRYWSNMDMTQSITLDSFKNQKAYMQAEHEASPDMLSELTDCIVNGNEAYYCTISGVRQISWYDQESDLFYVLTVPMDFSTEEIISMAESIALK